MPDESVDNDDTNHSEDEDKNIDKTFSDADSYFDASNDASILTVLQKQQHSKEPHIVISDHKDDIQKSLYPSRELNQIIVAENQENQPRNEDEENAPLQDKNAKQIHSMVSTGGRVNGMVSTTDFVDATTRDKTVSRVENENIEKVNSQANVPADPVKYAKTFTRYTGNHNDAKKLDDDLFTPSSSSIASCGGCLCEKFSDNRSTLTPPLAVENKGRSNSDNTTAGGMFARQQSFNARPNASSPSSSKAATYEHPFYAKFDPASQKYFQLLQRYHLADTLPVYFRAKMQMQLRSIGADMLTIGLFGPPGVGKSAFLNSVYATMNGEYVEYSAERKVNGDLSTSSTDSRLELRLTETITFLDNRATDFSKDSLKEISRQCEGYREAGMTVPEDWGSTFKQRFKDLFASCSEEKLFRNRIFCPVVVDSLQRAMDSSKYKKLIESIKKACGYNPIIVLTHKDKVDNGQEDVDERMRKFEHLNCNRLFALTNYTFKSHENSMETDKLVLQMLFNCCLVADQEMKMMLKRLNGSCCKC